MAFQDPAAYEAARAATLRNRSLDRARENEANRMMAINNPIGSTPGRDGLSKSGRGINAQPPGVGKPPYEDAILREARKVKPATSVARTGSDQPNRELRFPIEKTEYRAEIIFTPMKSRSIIDDLDAALTSSAKVQTPDPEASHFSDFAGLYGGDVGSGKSLNEASRGEAIGGRIQLDANDEGMGKALSSRIFEKAGGYVVNSGKEILGLNEANAQHEGQQPSFQPIKGNSGGGLNLEQIGSSCRLYLPQAIQIADGVQVGPIDLGVVGAGAEGAIAGGLTDAKALAVNALKNSDITSIIDVFKNQNLQSTAGAFAANRAATLLGSPGVAGAVARGTQVQVNPNTRSLFRSVNIREFAFTFKMIAASGKEAGEIKAIIEFFRKELYPEEIKLGTGGIEASFAYRMPNMFGIKMLHPGSKDGTIATRIKPCYLRNFTAVYNPGGMGMHSDGNFIETDITMSFVEHTTLSRADINEGF